jgi:hypothetical protein
VGDLVVEEVPDLHVVGPAVGVLDVHVEDRLVAVEDDRLDDPHSLGEDPRGGDGVAADGRLLDDVLVHVGGPAAGRVVRPVHPDCQVRRPRVAAPVEQVLAVGRPDGEGPDVGLVGDGDGQVLVGDGDDAVDGGLDAAVLPGRRRLSGDRRGGADPDGRDDDDQRQYAGEERLGWRHRRSPYRYVTGQHIDARCSRGTGLTERDAEVEPAVPPPRSRSGAPARDLNTLIRLPARVTV